VITLLVVVLAGVLMLQAGSTALFTWLVQRRLARRPPLATPPAAAEVVLCLRGADASLPAALAALAAQQYLGPWRLLLVVDSPADPAWELAAGAIAQLEASGEASWRAARMVALAEHPQKGSLKSAALRQAFDSLDPATAVVALVDADAVVAPGWLEALVAGCDQPGVGAVSGNRWYSPAQGSGAGQVRAIWNAGALVLMTMVGIPWGGSLAVRVPLIETSGWRDVLASSFCEDTALPAPLARSGWRYQFRPELLALDCDDGIALRPLRRWISRQLLTVRLHHSAWPLVLLHGVGTWLLLLLVLLALGFALALGRWAEAAVLLLALLAYELGCWGLLLTIRVVASWALRPLGEPLPALGWAHATALLRWMPLTQWVYGLATLQAALARTVEWRGVHYRVRGRTVERISRTAWSGR
jgi:hypothetical protein